MINQLRSKLQSVIFGQDSVIEDVLLALLAGGHVLLEGVPGVGKTMLVKSLARYLSLEAVRIQFTPDMLPSDVTGSVMYDQREGEFRVECGPIFANIVLADEINRTPPKTQAALLEAMEERQVTLYGKTLPLPRPFYVIATQNPIEYEGTYPLPEAQLDRFLLKVEMGYPGLHSECAMLQSFQPTHLLGPDEPGKFASSEPPIMNGEELLDLHRQVARVEVAEPVIRYIAEIVSRSRGISGIALGASPRAATAMLMASKAAAFLEERNFATPDDVKRVAHPVLGHRLLVTPGAQLEGVRAGDIIDELIRLVVVPR